MQKDSKNIVRQKTDSKPIDELRDLILGLQPHELNTLQNWLKNPDAFTLEISEILPKAVIISVKQNGLLAGSLLPVVEDAIFRSVQKNPKALADALFPIMGPAIRQSISDTFRRMIQSLNETLEKQFSAERIKWRLQALFSSQSYAEIVLLKGLHFNVLGVLLIHKETGLLLQEVHDENTKFDESDMISSMLTAIQDFVHDSFAGHLNQGDTLDTIRLHDFNVWIETGPYAYMAVIFEGDAPESKREIFKVSLEKIHKNYNTEIKDFNGDNTPTEALKPILQDCLISQGDSPKKSNSKKVILIGIIILLLSSIWIGFSIYNKLQWKHFIGALEKQPSVMIVDEGFEDGSYYVKGLKDVLANDFYDLALKNKLDTDRIDLRWTNYISMSEPYILKRLTHALSPNSTTDIIIKDGVIIFKGKAPRKWISQAKDYFTKQGNIYNINFNMLYYSELDSIISIKNQIENIKLEFKVGVSLLNKQQKDKLNTFVKLYGNLIDYQSDVKLQIVVILDNTGSKSDNERFAKQRINTTKRYIKSRGIADNLISTKINIASKTDKPRTLKFKIE